MEKRLRLAEDSLKRLDAALRDSGIKVSLEIEADVTTLKCKFCEICVRHGTKKSSLLNNQACSSHIYRTFCSPLLSPKTDLLSQTSFRNPLEDLQFPDPLLKTSNRSFDKIQFFYLHCNFFLLSSLFSAFFEEAAADSQLQAQRHKLMEEAVRAKKTYEQRAFKKAPHRPDVSSAKVKLEHLLCENLPIFKT